MYDIYCIIEPEQPFDKIITVNINGTEVRTPNKILISSDVTPDSGTKVREATIEMERGTCGKLSFKLPPQNRYYDFVQDYSAFYVKDVNETYRESGRLDEGIIFEGPLAYIGMDFYRNKKIEVDEGMAYLNMSHIGTKFNPLSNQSNLYQQLVYIVNKHNESIFSGHKQFLVGVVNMPGLLGLTEGSEQEREQQASQTVFTSTYDGESAAYYLNKLKETYNGYFKVLYETRNVGNNELLTGRFIDYLKDDVTENGPPGQEINFGINLLDFVKEIDLREFYTKVTPVGGQYVDSQGNTKYHTIADLPSISEQIQMPQDIMQKYGSIWKQVVYEDIGKDTQDDANHTIAKALYAKAKSDMENQLASKLKVEFTAADLHYLDHTIKHMDIHTNVRIISRPHGVDTVLPCRKIQIDLANPSNNKYTLSNEGQKFGSTSNLHSTDTLSSQLSNINRRKNQM